MIANESDKNQEANQTSIYKTTRNSFKCENKKTIKHDTNKVKPLIGKYKNSVFSDKIRKLENKK